MFVGVWEIIDAIGSFGGMILAAAAGYVAYGLFKVESRRDDRTERLRRESQASSVGLWIEDGKLVIANLSALPIYNVRLSYEFTDTALPSDGEVEAALYKIYKDFHSNVHEHGLFFSALRPNQTERLDLLKADWHRVNGVVSTHVGEHVTLTAHLTPVSQGSEQVEIYEEDERSTRKLVALTVDYGCRFTDNAQNDWFRGLSGTLMMNRQAWNES